MPGCARSATRSCTGTRARSTEQIDWGTGGAAGAPLLDHARRLLQTAISATRLPASCLEAPDATVRVARHERVRIGHAINLRGLQAQGLEGVLAVSGVGDANIVASAPQRVQLVRRKQSLLVEL